MKRFVLGVVAAVGLAAAAPAVAQAPTVTLAVGKPGSGPQGTTTTVRYGELVRVSGELSNGQPNQSIDLTVTPYRGETRHVALRTDSSGEFRFTHRATIRTGYTARWNGVASAQEPYAHVRPNVGLRVISARRGVFRVVVRAQPEHVSHVATFQRRIGSRWAKVKRVRLSRTTLTAVFSARIPRGVHRVRILVPQTPGYLRATSAHVRVVR